MLGYVTVGVSNVEKSKKFWVDLLKPLGAEILMDLGRIVYIGPGPGQPMFGICEPYDGGKPTSGNGVMLGFNAGSREAVDELYAKALTLGASDEGAPGPRFPEVDGKVIEGIDFYGAYIRDLDGNKVVFYELA